MRCVVHYQVPASADVYVHRSGRTARAGEEGLAVALVAPKDQDRYRALLQVCAHGAVVRVNIRGCCPGGPGRVLVEGKQNAGAARGERSQVRRKRSCSGIVAAHRDSGQQSEGSSITHGSTQKRLAQMHIAH